MPLDELNCWQGAKIFPADKAAMLDNLAPEQRKPASRERWTSADLERLKAVLPAVASDLEAAQILSAEFGRRLFEPSVTKQRRFLFSTEGWKPERKAPQSPELEARGRER
jgi:hypothetical protein